MRAPNQYGVNSARLTVSSQIVSGQIVSGQRVISVLSSDSSEQHPIVNSELAQPAHIVRAIEGLRGILRL